VHIHHSRSPSHKNAIWHLSVWLCGHFTGININATPFYSGCWPFTVIGHSQLFKMVFVCVRVCLCERLGEGWNVIMCGRQFCASLWDSQYFEKEHHMDRTKLPTGLSHETKRLGMIWGFRCIDFAIKSAVRCAMGQWSIAERVENNSVFQSPLSALQSGLYKSIWPLQKKIESLNLWGVRIQLIYWDFMFLSFFFLLCFRGN